MRNKEKLCSISLTSTFLIFIFLVSMSSTASAKEITVDDDSEADFVSIQEAVNNSATGDIILVRPGTYTENVLVNVKGLTIRSEPNNGDAKVKPLNESERFRCKNSLLVL